MVRSYQEANDYLDHLITLPVQAASGVGLERVRLLLAEAGNPQERFVTLHVTGSSGKGSTVAFSSAILRAAGYRVGAFTSPHLHDRTERIAVDGVPIPPADFARLLDRLQPAIERMADGTLPGYTAGRPSFLEVLWTMAALYFVESGVGAVVAEVGMGGRFDATNVNAARVAIITNVTLEHTHRLGGTVGEIAWHKAGVTKHGGIVVTASSDPAALTVIADECAREGATLWRVAESPASCAGDAPVSYYDGPDGLDVVTPSHAYHALRPRLLGHHQRTNAACAVAAVDALTTLKLVRVDEDAMRRGVGEAYIAGRLERVADDPETVLDGAHNPDAAHALAAALREIYTGRRLVLLLGILGDKDATAMVDALAPLATAIVVTEPPWAGRNGKGPDVVRLSSRYVSDVEFIPDVTAAYQQARRRARERHAALIVTGSLILVGAVGELVTSDE